MALVYCCSLDGLIASIVLLICTSLWIKASAKCKCKNQHGMLGSVFTDGAALESYVNQLIPKGIANMTHYQSKVVKTYIFNETYSDIGIR